MSESSTEPVVKWILPSAPLPQETNRVIHVGKVTVTKHPEVESTQYSIEGSADDPSVEIYISDEARKWGLGFRQLRELALGEVGRIQSDPFGQTSIDPAKDEAEARRLRTVNHLSDSVQALISVPIAIKGNGFDSNAIDKENLLLQYTNMRYLEVSARQKLTPEQQAILSFAKVYGAFSIGTEEFLIMEHVKEAQRVRDYAIIVGKKLQLAFSSHDDKELVHVFPDLERKVGFFRTKYVLWRDITEKLSAILGVKLNDLAGRNVLKQLQPDGKWKYIIIDQKAENAHLV